MNQQELEAILQRSLTMNEVNNLDLYLEIATNQLNSLLCTDVRPFTGTRKFSTRYGYHSAYIDPATTVTSVKRGGTTVQPGTYDLRQWDRWNADWYNVLVFDNLLRGEAIEVTGSFGWSTLPGDLQLLLGKLFDGVSKSTHANGQVKSKKVEDFSISYRDNENGGAISTLDTIANEFAETIARYSLCNVPNVQQGALGGC